MARGNRPPIAGSAIQQGENRLVGVSPAKGTLAAGWEVSRSVFTPPGAGIPVSLSLYRDQSPIAAEEFATPSCEHGKGQRVSPTLSLRLRQSPPQGSLGYAPPRAGLLSRANRLDRITATHHFRVEALRTKRPTARCPGLEPWIRAAGYKRSSTWLSPCRPASLTYDRKNSLAKGSHS